MIVSRVSGRRSVQKEKDVVGRRRVMNSLIKGLGTEGSKRTSAEKSHYSWSLKGEK